MKIMLSIAVTACLLLSLLWGLGIPEMWRVSSESAGEWYPLVKVYQANNIDYKWRMEWHDNENNEARNKDFWWRIILDAI
jgi:hypothetical protein